MDVWHYRVSILEQESIEGSFITALSDSDFNPKVVERFSLNPSINNRKEVIVRIEIEDEELQNNAEALMAVFDVQIMAKSKKGKVKLRTKLKRYTKHRVWEMVSICGGTLGTTTIPLIKFSSNNMTYPNELVIGGNFLLSLIPTGLYYFVGLRNLNKQSLTDN